MAERTLIVPKSMHLSDYGREFGEWLVKRGFTDPKTGRYIPPIAGGMASFSDYLELKVLDYIFNDPSTAFITGDVFLGLWTSALTDASTGSTTGEAAYTGYARLDIPPASMSAAAAGSKTNSSALTFAACTAGSATITFFGTFDAATVGNMLTWGTCTSTTVDTSHTPATVAIGALAVTLD